METQNATLFKDHVGQRILFHQGTGMRGNGRYAFGRPPCFQRQDRFLLGHPAGDFKKTGRILERLDMNHDDFCLFILAIIIDDFIHAHIGFIPKTGIHPYPLADTMKVQLQCLADASALGHYRDIAGFHRHECKVGIDRNRRIGILNALRVGAVNTHIVLVRDFNNLLFKLKPFFAYLFEARRMDNGEFYALLAALFENNGDQGVLNRYVYQIYFIRNVADRRVSLKAFDHS